MAINAPIPKPNFLADAVRLALAAGLSHDLGKAGSWFVAKLREAVRRHGKPVPDLVRHEWLSMMLIERLAAGMSLVEAWRDLDLDGDPDRGLADLPARLDGALAALRYVVGTHHRLFGPLPRERGQALMAPDQRRHVRDVWPIHREPLCYPVTAKARLSGEAETRLRRAVEALRETSGSEPYWYGLAWWVRAALILADHQVSAKRVGRNSPEGEPEPIPARTKGAFANTWQEGNETLGYNQTLEYHLAAVAERAAELAEALGSLELPSLDPASTTALCEPVADRHKALYGWQDSALALIRQRRGASMAPLLIFNVASTGAGKTQMNVKAGIAASRGAVRLSYGLNLRSLTLQTGTALRREMRFDKSALATVIGERVQARLHETQMTAACVPVIDTEGEEQSAQELGITVKYGMTALPEWLGAVLPARPEWERMLATPVLVSTVDFLVEAGEPGRQGRHVAAYLRMMHSDLILDEVDSYDTEGVVALLRLIHVAGMLGRNVICSSATLSLPIAWAIEQVYASGIEVWRAMHDGAPAHEALLLSDRLASRALMTGKAFESSYRDFQSELRRLPVSDTKKLALQTVESKSWAGFEAAVVEAVDKLHTWHRWHPPGSERTLSVGLVRVETVKAAKRLAKALDALPNTRVCLYHARDFVIQRYLKERALDRLLSRKQGNEALISDAEIQTILAEAQGDSVRLIVVATPVAEVGRDHDYDWAVVEPTSLHSIIQTAGRVNRHRLVRVEHPNVMVLQRNWGVIEHNGRGPGMAARLQRALGGKEGGFDLARLLDWSRLDYLPAGLGADGSHPLVVEELALQAWALGLELEIELEKEPQTHPLDVISRRNGFHNHWMSSSFYAKYPLRSGSDAALEEWRYVPDETGRCIWQCRKLIGMRWTWEEEYDVRSDDGPELDMISTSWLSWTHAELILACEEAGLTPEEGMRIQCRRRPGP